MDELFLGIIIFFPIAILSLILKESVTSLKEIQKVFDDANAINEGMNFFYNVLIWFFQY